ncbi:MAG TPA: hypothetical protein VED46_07135 [Alphaproteobacteria bacterium]|nr:hypothetical protein [Alphaproteobacteria bacterium]
MAVTPALQVSAEWLGSTLGLLVWRLLASRVDRVLAIGMAALAVIGTIELAGIQLPGRYGSNDAELAGEFSPKAATHPSTSQWRELWWEQIWLSVHSSP